MEQFKDYFPDIDMKLQCVSLKDNNLFVTEFPIDIHYLFALSVIKGTREERSLLLQTDLIDNKGSKHSVVMEFAVESREDKNCTWITPSKIISADDSQFLLNSLNELEDESFFENSSVHKKLKKIFFKSAKVIPFTGEGMDVRSGVVLLGTRSGPRKGDLSALAHEMGHLIEIDDKRANKKLWGFDYSYQETPSQFPRTYNATLREVRAATIQCKIYDMIGQSYEIESVLSALNFMDDWINVPGKNDKERMAFLIKYFKEYEKTISEDWGLSEWERKNSIL